MKTYLLRHVQVLLYSLGQLARAPVATLMTVSVIGITLALPSALYVLIGNIEQLGRSWEESGQISLFLRHDVSEKKAEQLARTLRHRPGVKGVDYVSREAALTEFKRLSGFGEVLNTLDQNPLPAVLVVRPTREAADPLTLERLAGELRALPEVDLAQFDLQWVQRLHAILRLAERSVWMLTAVLAAGVLLIIGNTIRLAVLNRRDEIEIIKLIGGTNAFIRRPFLYAGLLQGLIGGIVAWLLVVTALIVLTGPVSELAHLYGSEFSLHGLGLTTVGLLLGGGAALGWMGSRIAVGRHLLAINPK